MVKRVYYNCNILNNIAHNKIIKIKKKKKKK